LPSITSSDGIRLEYLEAGDPAGRPIVLIAGFKAPATSWRYQVKPLTRAGHRVIAFDRRGHGASEASVDGHDMDRQGEDLGDLVSTLGLDDATLVGQSMGGNAIWAHVAAAGTRGIRDIVIIDQTPKMLNAPDWEFGFYGYDDTNVDTLFAAGIPDPGRYTAASKGAVRIARVVRAMDMRRTGLKPTFTAGELALLNDHAKRDWRAVVAAVDVPAFFIAGDESEFWPAEHAAASAALNPLADSTVIERDGHAANIEQPQRFNDALLAFLAR
jgi:non-heme chloroperoxidase